MIVVGLSLFLFLRLLMGLLGWWWKIWERRLSRNGNVDFVASRLEGNSRSI
jgi:hypothetical protein